MPFVVFPEALRKFDQVLDITPDDPSILAVKAGIAQREGDLPRAAALLAPLHPAAHNPAVFLTQFYQAILERRPAQIITQIKEILAKPDPALVGYDTGWLRFFLGWAQEVAGDHAAAQESWRQARSEMEPFLKEQPENPDLIEQLALTNMGLGDKAAAFKLIERAMAVVPIEKDALEGPVAIETLACVAAQMGEPDRAIAALQKLLSIPYTRSSGAHSCAAPARSDVRSAAERSAFSETRRLAHAEVTSGKRRACLAAFRSRAKAGAKSNALLACWFRRLAETTRHQRTGTVIY